jgi:hypothetical protein
MDAMKAGRAGAHFTFTSGLSEDVSEAEQNIPCFCEDDTSR